jgi:hypothetical protein
LAAFYAPSAAIPGDGANRTVISDAGRKLQPQKLVAIPGTRIDARISAV